MASGEGAGRPLELPGSPHRTRDLRVGLDERYDLGMCVDAMIVRDPRLYTPPGVDCPVDGHVA